MFKRRRRHHRPTTVVAADAFDAGDLVRLNAWTRATEAYFTVNDDNYMRRRTLPNDEVGGVRAGATASCGPFEVLTGPVF